MKKVFKYFTSVLVALAIWIIADWYWPVKSSIRRFDPDKVAKLDTKMWRAYYSKESR